MITATQYHNIIAVTIIVCQVWFLFVVLVDKDNNPNWSPSTLEAVMDDKVESFFSPFSEPGEQELCLKWTFLNWLIIHSCCFLLLCLKY